MDRTCYQHVDSQVEFESIDEERLMDVSLGDAVRFLKLDFFEALDEINSFALALVGRLYYECFIGLLEKLISEIRVLCWQDPSGWGERVRFWKHFLHPL